MELSACSKLEKSLLIASASMPIPVSSTSHRRIQPSASDVALTRTTTDPASVNFTALETRFSRIWRSRVGSSSTVGGSACRITSRRTCFASAAPRISPATSSTRSLTEQGSGSIVMRPASSFE